MDKIEVDYRGSGRCIVEAEVVEGPPDYKGGPVTYWAMIFGHRCRIDRMGEAHPTGWKADSLNLPIPVRQKLVPSLRRGK